eukprot:11795-Heterococcus_DN1.PRE.1
MKLSKSSVAILLIVCGRVLRLHECLALYESLRALVYCNHIVMTRLRGVRMYYQFRRSTIDHKLTCPATSNSRTSALNVGTSGLRSKPAPMDYN